MSVLIKGMEMPKSCGECKFFAWKRGVGNHCAIDESITFHATLDGFDVRYEKNGNCPLVEVPTPHGRLIDADAAYNQFLNLMDIQGAINPCQLGTILVDAPTVIESECESEGE